MRVLVTGGSGVIGAGLLPELIRAGHDVRLLTRHATGAAGEWPDEVTPFDGDISDPDAIRGAAEGCRAIVHISGIVAESPPALTFARVNVGGTRHLLAEAERSGSPRFVYVSSLGCDRGRSAYHASKREAEELVRRYPGSWAIVRPGSVYGPGDDVISLLVTMHGTLPAVPVVGFGDQPFQPIFFADLGQALAAAARRRGPSGIFEVAGDEVTTSTGILALCEELIGRWPLPLPVPQALAGLATRVAGAAGLPFPLDESKFQMLLENNVIDPPSKNALTRTFGVSPTPLREGLMWLLEAQPEQGPADGVGRLEYKRFVADIRDTPYDAAAFMERVREQCTALMPVEFGAEPAAPQEIAEGVSLTAALPLRGSIQVRVEDVTPRSFTFATLRGHPLAGIVRFDARDIGPRALRFTVTVCARPATAFDWLAMKTVGRLLQNQNWIATLERAVVLSQGTCAGVQVDERQCDDDAATYLERRIADLIASHRRRRHSAGQAERAS